MTRWIAVFLAGFALWPVVETAHGQQAMERQFYGSGVHHYFANAPAEAIADFTLAIEAGSRDPRVYYFRGLSYLRQGERDQAAADFLTGAKLEYTGLGRLSPVARSLQRVQGRDRKLLERYRTQGRMEAARHERERLEARYGIRRRAELNDLRRQAGVAAHEEPLADAPKDGAERQGDAGRKDSDEVPVLVPAPEKSVPQANPIVTDEAPAVANGAFVPPTEDGAPPPLFDALPPSPANSDAMEAPAPESEGQDPLFPGDNEPLEDDPLFSGNEAPTSPEPAFGPQDSSEAEPASPTEGKVPLSAFGSILGRTFGGLMPSAPPRVELPKALSDLVPMGQPGGPPAGRQGAMELGEGEFEFTPVDAPPEDDNFFTQPPAERSDVPDPAMDQTLPPRNDPLFAPPPPEDEDDSLFFTEE